MRLWVRLWSEDQPVGPNQCMAGCLPIAAIQVNVEVQRTAAGGAKRRKPVRWNALVSSILTTVPDRAKTARTIAFELDHRSLPRAALWLATQRDTLARKVA